MPTSEHPGGAGRRGDPIEPWPPRLFARALRAALPGDLAGESIAGDMHEEFVTRARSYGVRTARRWYGVQAAGIVARAVRDRLVGSGPLAPARTGRHGNRGDPIMAKVWSDVRYAARGLARAPQFTVVGVLTLALAIGANAAIFSVVDGILLKPLPFRDSEALVVMRHTAPGLGYPRFGISPGVYERYRRDVAAFESTALYREDAVNLTGDGSAPERVPASVATASVFPTLGVSAAMGRTFTGEEDAPGGTPVVVLSDELWRQRFGGRPDVVGETMRVNGETREIVGVMPPDFAFPSADTRLWMPFQLDTANAPPGNFAYQAIGRLKPGADAEAARSQMQAVIGRLGEAFPDAESLQAFITAGKLSALVETLKQDTVGDLGQTLWILLGTVVFVFLIACANVTNLFLVRSEGRQREMAVRAALGAGRGRLIRHHLAEGALLAAGGVVVGLGLAWVGVRGLLAIAPPSIPRLDQVTLDYRVVSFALAAAAVAAVLLGLVPAFRVSRPALLGMLGHSGRGSTAGRERHRVRQMLVVAQTALALVLLVGSGLMVRSFQQIRDVDPGFVADGVLTFRVSLPNTEYAEAGAVEAFHRRLLDKLRALPGVRAAGGVQDLPLGGAGTGTAHQVEDFPTEAGQLPPMFWYTYATPGYLEAMRMRVVAGRGFEESDMQGARRNVMVSAALARRLWPGQDVIGKRLRAESDTLGWNSIIGVVNNVRDKGLDEEVSDMVYYPFVGPRGDGEDGERAIRSMTYAVRASNPVGLTNAVREQVWALDRNLPVAAVATMTEVLSRSTLRLSFTMIALVVAATVALLLGAIGLYGVISYIVSHRTQEIGVRMALGARPAEVRRMVVAQGLRLSALGLVIGFVAALGMTRLLQGLLFGTEPTDPATFASVSLVLVAVGLVATYVPAHRASRIDPARSLKSD